MPTIDSTAAIRYGGEQLRVQQARQVAAQAEQTARAMESRAATAKRTAAQATEEARSLEVQSSQARTTAGKARQGVAAMESASQAKLNIADYATRAVQAIQVSDAATGSAPLGEAVAASTSYTASGTATTAPAGSIVDTTA